jgi:SecD/SecF fusion protein
LANNSKNPVFNQALANATKNRQGNEDYLDVFFREFEKASNGTTKLARLIFSPIKRLLRSTSKMTDAETQKSSAKK